MTLIKSRFRHYLANLPQQPGGCEPIVSTAFRPSSARARPALGLQARTWYMCTSARESLDASAHSFAFVHALQKLGDNAMLPDSRVSLAAVSRGRASRNARFTSGSIVRCELTGILIPLVNRRQFRSTRTLERQIRLRAIGRNEKTNFFKNELL